MLWCQFIQIFGLHDLSGTILGKDYHLKRVGIRLFSRRRLNLFIFVFQIKRFSEGFFVRERSRQHYLINEGDSYNDFHELIRNSSYYNRLQSLPIECLELDGIPDTLPILIEEIYSSVDENPLLHQLIPKNKPNHDNAFVQAVQNFSKNLIKGT